VATVSLTKCLGEECPLRNRCKRYTNKAADVQAYGIYDEARMRLYGHMYACDHFVINEPRRVANGKI